MTELLQDPSDVDIDPEVQERLDGIHHELAYALADSMEPDHRNGDRQDSKRERLERRHSACMTVVEESERPFQLLVPVLASVLTRATPELLITLPPSMDSANISLDQFFAAIREAAPDAGPDTRLLTPHMSMEPYCYPGFFTAFADIAAHSGTHEPFPENRAELRKFLADSTASQESQQQAVRVLKHLELAATSVSTLSATDA